MTAPVRGSGSWPAWITLVSGFMGHVLASGLHLAAQPVQQVDPRDEAEELVALDHNRDQAAIEDLHQLPDFRIGRHRDEPALHRLGDGPVEVARIVEHLETDVNLPEHAVYHYVT